MRLKIMMMLCVITACTLCGCSLANAAAERRKFLEKLVTALKKLRLYVVDRIMPIGHALTETGFPLFSGVAERIEQEKSLYEAWMNIAGSQKNLSGATEDEKSMLNGMFAQLGESGRKMQDELLCGYIQTFEESVKNAKEREKQVCRLYASIGFLLGTAIAILLV